MLRPCFINTPHAAIESMWFNYAIDDVPAAIEQATGARLKSSGSTTRPIHGRCPLPRIEIKTL